MASYGGYETVRELYRSGLASSFSARKAGETAARYTVKLYQPFLADAGLAEGLKSQIDSFLDAARLQQKVASSGAKHWAPIHEVGQVPGGAFCVGEFHRRSVQHLIAGRVKLTAAGLYQLIHAVVEGLSELKKVANRPHGNLKPSNILLTGKGKLSKACPLLADPAGADKLDPAVGDVVDFHAIGELIYQLVLHRTGKAMGGWPAPEAPEWQRLGKNGEPWRQLCNRLLNPNLAPNLLTFDDLLEDLRKLRLSETPVCLILVPAAAVIVLGAVAAMLFWPSGADEGAVWDANSAARWQSVCTDFGNWVEPLLSSREEGRLKSWQADAYLKASALPLLGEVVRNANPRRIAGQTWGDVFKLGRTPTDQARRPKAIRQTEFAAEVYQRLKAVLSSPDWPAYARLCKSAKAFADRGWDAQAQYLQTLEPVGDHDVAGRVQAILDVQDELVKIEQLWTRADKLVQAAGAWQAGPKGLDAYVAGRLSTPPPRPGPDGIADLADRLEEIQNANHPLRQLVQYVHSDSVRRLDMAFVNHSPPFAVPDGAQMTEEILRRGLAELQSGKYDLRPDPRDLAWKADVSDKLTGRRGDLQSLDEAITKLLAEENIPPADKQALDAARQKVSALRKSVEQVASVFDRSTRQTTYDYNTREKIDDDIEAIDTGLKGLARNVGSASMEVDDIRKRILRARAATLAEYQKALRSRARISATALSVIDEKWVAQRDALLASEKTVEGLAEKVDRLEKFLRSVEDAFQPELVEGKADEVKAWQRPWNRALLTEDLESRRRNSIATVLSYVDWPKVLAGQADEGLKVRMDKVTADYNAWRTGLATLVPAVNREQDLLTDGYMLDEKPADGGKTIVETYQPIRTSAVLLDPAAAAAAKPILDRITRLEKVATMSVAELQTVAMSGKPGDFEAARAAWLKLGTVTPAWPGDDAGLKQEIDIRKNLSTLYDLLDADARKRTLRTELASQSRDRWLGYFLTRGDAKQIESAISRMSDFGLSPDDASLPPLVKYRLAMSDFRRQMFAAKRDLDDDAVKTAIATFQGKVNALPASFKAGTDFTTLMKGLDKLRQEKNTAIDLTKAGPGGAGWAMTAQTADTVTYSWTGRDQKLTFVRVTPPGGEPCFLCTTEVSLGLFINVVMGRQKWSAMQTILPGDVDEPRGPRSWVRSGGSLRIDPTWYPVVPPVLSGRLYPQGLTVDKPNALLPVQQVPMPAAVYFARLINCRLPTSAEWQAAHAADKKSASRQPYNLRDKTWLRQKQHDVGLEDSGDLLDPDLYYPDAGIFWPTSIAASRRKTGRDGEAWPNAPDDGVLWFAKVVNDNQRVFQNLVGNVAEYVYEDSKALSEMKNPTPAQVRQLLKAGAAGAKVIGGSAMSAPQVAVDKPQALGNPSGNECYSDVGFRLAFLAGRERLQTTLEKLLGSMAHQGYLPPAPGR